MTQSFTFREPVSDLGQGVLSGSNMMPPWKQSAAYNLVPNDGAEKQGQRRRRESELTRGLMPNERLSNDSFQQSGNGPSTGGNNIYDLGGAQSAFAVDKQNFFERMEESVRSSVFPSTRGGVASTNPPIDHQQYYNDAAYRLSQRPTARSLDLATAATAQAMANFKALLGESWRQSSSFQANNGAENDITQGYATTLSLSAQGNQQQHFQSNHGFEVPSCCRATGNLFSTSITNQTGFEYLSSFGDVHRNAPRRSEVSGETSWPNLNCQTSASNVSRFVFESNPEEPRSPCTPQVYHQVADTVLSDSQKEYLRHMERINSIAATELKLPQYQNSGGGRRSGSAIFGDFDPVSDFQAEKHVHGFLDNVEVRERVDVSHAAQFPVLEASTGFRLGVLEDAQESRYGQSVESASVVAPVESSIRLGVLEDAQESRYGQNVESASVVAPVESSIEPEFTGGRRVFDLNEVPVAVGEAATPKPRKKYHPRVAKDKRTYRRRVDGKIDAASSVGGFTKTSSPAKKAGKRSSNQTQYDSTNDEGRDTSHPEVVDMDIEYNGYTQTSTSQHDTAICDCEGCIKLRLEKRMPQSPVSPPQQHSWQSPLPRADSSPNSPSVRRTLFQPSTQAPEVLIDQGSEPAARRSRTCSDTTDYSPDSSEIPQHNTAYSAVKSFFSTSSTTTSCLQQVDESAPQLGLTQSNNDSSLSSALASASQPSPACSHNNRVPATQSNNSLMSRLCPRGILFPQTVPFRNMTQFQRVVYLRSFLSSSEQLKMSPETLLKHVHDFIPESEKNEFKEAVWPLVLAHLTDDQEKRFSEYAKSEQVGASKAVVKVVKRKQPGKATKPSKKQLALTVWGDSQAVEPSSKAGKGQRGRKSSGGAAGAAGPGVLSQNGLEMVPYENKAVVPYDGPFNPLRKKKDRAKVVLDDETVRVWKLLMGKRGSERVETDAQKEAKWEEERRKMQTQAQIFIERMHTVIGDRSFSKWKGSVVDSVVGAFLTQNVNDVLSSSAFMSMRSRFPGLGFRSPSEAKAADPEEVVAQSFGSEHPSLPAQFPPMQPQSSGIPEAASSSQHPSPQDVAALQPNPECSPPTSVTVLESQESRNEESYEILHKEVAASTQAEQPGALELQSGQREDSKTSNSVLTDELSTGANQPENAIIQAFTTESQPSHGKYNPKTGLTGLERAKIEEKQVSARKDFDFSEMQAEFRPRVQGQERRAAPARTEATEDGVDWEAVRRADVAEVADVIKERGLNWILAGRIKAFLERMHQDYGALDLEWLRSMSTDQTKEFLLSIRGLGLKSVECIRLLTLHHLAFPVDTNVGRICVRLGWVPLEPLPEELQLHLLELYPVQATIQKYLWPRLCKFDHRTLYELHYQMITFGKVFCTKTKPNCNACPMRPECKHFASALSSAKLALPASERPNSGPTLALPPGENVEETSRPVSQYCQPIIEEPMTPESEVDMEDFDSEDYPFSIQELLEDDTSMCIHDQPSTEAATTHAVLQQCETIHNLNCCSPSIDMSISDTEPILSSEQVAEPVSESLLEPVQGSTIVEDWGSLAGAPSRSNTNQGGYSNNVIEIVDTADDLENSDNSRLLVANVGSQEMVLVAPDSACLPVPKLKNVGRLRTVHYVYELPDNHPLLDGLDPRQSDDPCTYLLAIWSPDEVPESIPNINDSLNEENGPFSSEGEESIKATLLVPCRTAMRGTFPLNGTYFQVNEVFADHASSLQPMLVPRTLLWNLRRRFVFFGTSVTSIFRGMTAAEIQACFWRGYVCVRGFDRFTRAPKPLVGRLHLQAGKAKGANADV